jgi:SNF2 family DNA or RNA helicase
MAISDLIKNIISGGQSETRFDQFIDSEGVNFICPKKVFDQCASGCGGGWMLHQFACLKILEEQGIAERLPNGFVVASEHVVNFDDDAKAMLDLPQPFEGKFKTKVRGETTRASFSVGITPTRADEQEEPVYTLKGPMLSFSSREQYLLTPEQFSAFEAVGKHEELTVDEKTETVNLRLIYRLQQSRAEGMPIELAHFDKIDVFSPEKVGVSATQQSDGSMLLTPSFGSGANPDAIHNRLGQVQGDGQASSLRVGEQIILLDEKRLSAANEIIENRHIPSNQVEAFLKSPSAFLDAALVDLDLGFSVRVKGATKFKFIPIGETDASGIHWFKDEAAPSTPGLIPKLVKSEEDMAALEEIICEAEKQGAEEISFDGAAIDISDKPALAKALNKAKEQLLEPMVEVDDLTSDTKGEDGTEERATVDIDEIETIDDDIRELASIAPYSGELDLSNLKRQPFPHQDEGIRWMLGLALQALSSDHSKVDRLQGGLMADDMGLGKTFMSLVALDQYYNHLKKENETLKPVLMVAPLSLLENWEDEVDLTFKKSPFSSIVTLQAGRQLKEFRIKGAKSETKQQVTEDSLLEQDAIRYSLKIGKEFGTERLDMPGRLVLTTYQTLRDYQFSMCLVDWSVIVFDEAQNIKSPNTLQARAAKGLKAGLKILATGTPVENSLADFWCLLDTAQPGLLGTWSDFRDTYITPIRNAEADNLNDVRLQVGQQLRQCVGSLMLRRMKEDNLKGLPQKHIYTGVPTDDSSGWLYKQEIASQMVGAQLDRYDDVVKNYRNKADSGDGQGAALAALQQLRQISLHPNMSDERALISSNGREATKIMSQSKKLESLLPLLNQIKNRDEKVIIFMMTKKLQRLMKVWLEQIYGFTVDVINGDTKAVSNKKDDLTRKGIIKKFEAQPGFGILIMSPVAAGVGLTVVGANNVIHLERHWNPAKEAQATDRVYRIGQVKDVNIYLPAVHHPEMKSFDVNLDGLLSRKTNLKDAVVTPDAVTEKDLMGALG